MPKIRPEFPHSDSQPTLARSLSTSAGTSPLTGATQSSSFTQRELTKLYASPGSMNTVSICGSSLRLIMAICNSYS